MVVRSMTKLTNKRLIENYILEYSPGGLQTSHSASLPVFLWLSLVPPRP